jgi:hypothetical protein
MMPRRKTAEVVLTALVLLPAAAWAGMITSVVANPSTAYVNQDVKVTVNGTGPCTQVVVRCQAPAAPEHVGTNVMLPWTVTCTYASTGTKTVTAAPEKPPPTPRSPDPTYCSGDKITQVTVKPTPTLDVDPGVFKNLLQPQIDNMLIFSKPSPGGAVLVLGKNFGSQPGKFQIVGQFGTRDLDKLDWGADGKAISGFVPDNICGVQSHPAKLIVTTKAGAKSNEFQVNYLPKKEWKWLTPSDVQVVTCSQDGNSNTCNGCCWADAFTGQPGGAAIFGWHSNCWGCIGDDSGTDKYQISLKNGWTLSQALFEEDDPGSEGDVNGPSPGFPSGASSWQPQYSWMATSGDSVMYAVAIEIEGPCGVPYK